eukprot:scaffold164685_cov30-Tisochrysis_lutea.AAC.1
MGQKQTINHAYAQNRLQPFWWMCEPPAHPYHMMSSLGKPPLLLAASSREGISLCGDRLYMQLGIGMGHGS